MKLKRCKSKFFSAPYRYWGHTESLFRETQVVSCATSIPHDRIFWAGRRCFVFNGRRVVCYELGVVYLLLAENNDTTNDLLYKIFPAAIYLFKKTEILHLTH